MDMFLGSATTHPKEGVPQRPQIFGTSYVAYAHAVWETATKFCTVIKLVVRKIFTKFSTALSWPEFCDTNADARSICGSSCLVFNSDGNYIDAALMQFTTKEGLYEQIRRCDIIIYHIVDDAGEIDEAVWAVSRK